MKNKIKNPKVEVASTQEMNDKDYLSVVLELEKNMSNNYSIAIDEASNDVLYNEYFDLFEDTKDMARELYDVMFQKGWYELEEAEHQEINEMINTFTSEMKELPELDD